MSLTSDILPSTRFCPLTNASNTKGRVGDDMKLWLKEMHCESVSSSGVEAQLSGDHSDTHKVDVEDLVVPPTRHPNNLSLLHHQPTPDVRSPTSWRTLIPPPSSGRARTSNTATSSSSTSPCSWVGGNNHHIFLPRTFADQL